MNIKSSNFKMIRILIIVVLSITAIALIYIAKNPTTVSALSSTGSHGTEVTQIQTRLKSWGYYTGVIDGSYGAKTQAAVIAFQKKNGLVADGIAGSATLRAIGISSSGGYGGYSSNDYNLIARVISAEARGEPFVGQVAVGAVILNRVEHPAFPNTVAGVIYQPGAFSCLQDGQFNQPVASSAYLAAQDAINGWDPTNGAIYYYNPATATSTWIWSLPVIIKIGNHVFCS